MHLTAREGRAGHTRWPVLSTSDGWDQNDLRACITKVGSCQFLPPLPADYVVFGEGVTLGG